jgi:amidase
VFVKGGLLYLGDVHAAMGDGELSGGGVETAAIVKLKVELIKNYQLTQPRFETKNRVVTTGWSFNFHEARSMAVSDMLDIVVASMKVTTTEAMMLISNAADLRIGQACGSMEMTLRLEMYKFENMKILP